MVFLAYCQYFLFLPICRTKKKGLKMNDSNDQNRGREELYSKAVRAGKRTYFFDVKATKSGDKYLTITESKRRFDNDSGKFSYEKHKIFLFKEDFEKFLEVIQAMEEFWLTVVKLPKKG